MEVYCYADRNGINEFQLKVTEKSPIDLSKTLRLFIEIEPYKLGQWDLLGIFSNAVHNITLYDFIFACKNNFSLVIIIFPPLLGLRSQENYKTDFNKTFSGLRFMSQMDNLYL